MKKSFQDNIRQKYIDKVIENLEDRFPDDELLSALDTIFNPESALKSSQSSESSTVFGIYGDSAVTTLSDHFKTTVTKTSLEKEWMGFKHILCSKLSIAKNSNVMSTLSTDSTLSSLYPSLSKIASIALSIPVSTASCERGFSTMNRIKTDLRNRLTSETLDKLIRLSS